MLDKFAKIYLLMLVRIIFNAKKVAVVMIDQRYCKYIKTIAECHSISKAAKALYISQPSLSRFLHRVEKEYGLQLFDRNFIPLKLTKDGEKYLSYVDKFQALDNEMRQDFSVIKQSYSNKLTIATLPFLGTFILPKIVPHFSNLYPAVDLQIKELGSRDLIKSVENGEADIIITNLKPVSKQLTYKKLCGDPMVLVTRYDEKMKNLYPKNESIIKKPFSLDWKLFLHSTLIYLHPWQNMRIASDAVCNHFNFFPTKKREVPSMSTALSLVGSGKGFTFACKSHLACIPSDEPLIYFSLGDMENYMCILAAYKQKTAKIFTKKFCEESIKVLSKF